MSVEMQNLTSLTESLEELVKGDLLEGDNAYYCSKCNKKVSVRKRMCIKRLPLILTLHLKRFSFDYERLALSLCLKVYFEAFYSHKKALLS